MNLPNLAYTQIKVINPASAQITITHTKYDLHLSVVPVLCCTLSVPVVAIPDFLRYILCSGLLWSAQRENGISGSMASIDWIYSMSSESAILWFHRGQMSRERSYPRIISFVYISIRFAWMWRLCVSDCLHCGVL